MRAAGQGLLLSAIAACASQSQPPPRTAKANDLNMETQRVAFELVKTTLLCFEGRPTPGKVVMAAEFSTPGSPIQVFDSESTPGNEAAIRCAIEKGSKLRSPQAPPSPFVRYMMVFPGGPEDIVFDFPKTSPPRKAP
jgi:hypothetical protein